MVMTVKLISPPLQLDNTITQSPMPEAPPQLPDFPLLHADGNMNEVRLLGCDLYCGHWCMIILILKAWQFKRAKHHEAVNIAFQAVKAQPTFQLDGTMIRKPMRPTLVPQQIFGALKMDFWLETMFGQGNALFMHRFSLPPRSSRPQMA